MKTYHANTLYSLPTASEIGGVGPVVRVPRNIGSVLTKCRLVGDLDTRESCDPGFDSVRGDIRTRSCAAPATGTPHGTAWSGARFAAGRTARGDGGGVRGFVELCYCDGRG